MASTIWKGHVSFGLISIPVKLVRAARAERVNLHRLSRAAAPSEDRNRAGVLEFPVSRGDEGVGDDGEAPRPASPPPLSKKGALQPPPAPDLPDEPPVERVRQAAVTAAGERPVPASDIVKGYEYQPDRWVVIGSDEIKSLAPQTSKLIEIVEFVRFGEIDPVYLESSYYVVPEKAGEKAYAVLYQALRETNFAAVAELAMHGREHIVVLRPGRTGLLAHTMFFENEVRKELEYRSDDALVTKRELDLAKMLVESLAGPFEPEKYRDTYREKLEALIAAKVQGHEVAGERTAAPARAQVTDLLEALQKSLDAGRKPPAQESRPEAEPKKKRAGRRGDK